MVKIVNGNIVDDEESGRPLVSRGIATLDSVSAANADSSNSPPAGASSDSVTIFGRQVHKALILVLFLLGFITFGFTGILFIGTGVGLGYLVSNGMPGASPSQPPPQSGPRRGRANIKGISDLPKPPKPC
jgi:hypothetical protein